MTEPVRVDAVVPVRHRASTVGETRRVVHLASLSSQATHGAIATLCGSLLASEQVERVELGAAMPCSMCLIQRVARHEAVEQSTALPAGAPVPAHRRATAEGYAALGWPVLVRGDHVLLNVDDDVLALIMPRVWAKRVQNVLSARSRPAPVLAHPHAPDHLIVLAGEPFGAELPWPDEVRAAVGLLPLPPTVTPAGPVKWEYLPDAHALSFCREVDVFGALRALGKAMQK